MEMYINYIYIIVQPHDSRQKRIIFRGWSLVIKPKIDFSSYKSNFCFFFSS